MGKGKVHYIEVLSDEEDDGEDESSSHRDSGQSSGEVEPPHLDYRERHHCRKGSRK
jgi:hypothetical protein